MTRRTLPLAAILLLATHAVAAPPAMTVTCDDADGIVDVGQKVTWTIAAQPGTTKVRYSLKRGGMTEIAAGPLEGESPTVVAVADAPGTLFLEVRATDANGADAKALGGVAIDPAKITPAAPRPDDFDQFWSDKLTELAAVPINAQVTEVDPTTLPAPATLPATTRATSAPTTSPDVGYFQVTLDNIRGTHVRGQLARPRAGETFPAILIVQWAGVYPLQPNWVRDRAAEGWLALNVSAHDLPITEPPSFYKEQDAGPLKGYSARGNTDRDASYFLRMYLGTARAIDYLKTRPDWDGKTLVVMGSSQGGMQTFVAAGLRPDDVTAAIANVPAGGDMLAQDAGRLPGWPGWVRWSGNAPKEKVREAARYYDIANFASRIKCPILVGLGLVDETCPPSSVYAAANQVTSPKEIVAMPTSGHMASHAELWKRAAVWQAALVKGQPAPVQ